MLDESAYGHLSWLVFISTLFFWMIRASPSLASSNYLLLQVISLNIIELITSGLVLMLFKYSADLNLFYVYELSMLLRFDPFMDDIIF